MHCTNCGNYYRLTPYNDTCFCDDCLAEQDMADTSSYPDLEVEKNLLLNPSGKTKAVFYDEDDSFGL